MKLNLIMPMAGRGTRFFNDGFVIPKPLIEIKEKPFFYWSTESIAHFFKKINIIFIVLKEHDEKFNISKKIKKYYSDSQIVVIPEVLDGAVLTAMQAINKIDNDKPILINDCDHMFKSSELNSFIEKTDNSIYGALLTFYSNSPKYSFVKIDDRGFVIGTKEKEVISNQAICGAYYFKDNITFQKYSEKYLKNCNYDEFFISGVYNELIMDKKNVITFKTDFHIPFGTPEEYYIAEESDKFEVLIK